MNPYERIAKETRKQVSVLSRQQEREVLKLYDGAVKGITEKIAKSKSGSLNERWLKDNLKEIKKARNELNRELNKSIRGFTTKAAKEGIEGNIKALGLTLNTVNIKVDSSFSGVFSSVQQNIVNDIIKGNLYKDDKTLSNRIWNHGKEFEEDIQYTINQAILQKKSAKELAQDLDKYLLEPAKRGAGWGATYTRLINKRATYNSQRLAQTSINHAYQNATVQSCSMNPFVEGILWQSVLLDVPYRTCELCAERDGVIFAVEDVPLDHPNGWCTMIPSIEKSLDEVAQELRDWLDGSDNEKLDNWYEKYGEHFI